MTCRWSACPATPSATAWPWTSAAPAAPTTRAYPDAITPRGTGASAIITSSPTYTAGIKADNGVHRVVYLGFGFEAINNATSRALLMQRICDWLLPYAAGVDDPQLPSLLAGLDNVPNPFNPRTEIAFTLAASGPVRLELYDIRGALVRVLHDGAMPGGDNRVVWDGRDDAGQPAPSGTYLCWLEADGRVGTPRHARAVAPRVIPGCNGEPRPTAAGVLVSGSILMTNMPQRNVDEFAGQCRL